MRYVILGYGRVGRPAALRLEDGSHDVTVVDNDPAKITQAKEAGLETVHGEGNDKAVLEDAGIGSADAFGALTDDIDVNAEACDIARETGCRTVLRVSTELDDETYAGYEERADEIVYPERVGAAAAKTALLGGDFNVISSLTEELLIARVSVPEDSPMLGERVVNIDLPGDSRIYAHGRAGEDMSIPLPQTKVEAGDSVAVMAESALMQDVRATLRGV